LSALPHTLSIVYKTVGIRAMLPVNKFSKLNKAQIFKQKL
jgi:hypothetical protein